MVQAIDHIIIAVRDLDKASDDYREAGFTVTPGGEHVGGATHNALVSFGDGAYFELIAFKNPDKEQEHKWWAKLHNGEGTVDYALLSSDLDAEAKRLQQAGVAVDGPHNGGRKRPDGIEIAWKTLGLNVDGVPLPFVLEDVTAHGLRVPPGQATRHALDAPAVAGLTILVPNLDRAAPVYEALLGTPGGSSAPNIEGVRRGRRFTLGTQWIELAEPYPSAAALQKHIQERGAAPYEIVLAGQGPTRSPLPQDLTHTARIRFETPVAAGVR
jgi:catechol 2,3-dioxygenase-like lactoylglutathione lyase family enzyme